MDFNKTIEAINKKLRKKQPESFNSSWILKNCPACYRFIQKNIRTHLGSIDWDKVTYALEWKFQRRWSPGHCRKNVKPYRNGAEVRLLLRRNRKRLYVFVVSQNLEDRRARDIISISLVRLAQNGNLSARKKLMELVGFTVNEWLYNYYFLHRWQGHKDELEKQIQDCIRRYRYTGSFLHYLFRTLEYAGRGIRPFYAYSLDKPVAWDAKKTLIENVVADPETGRATMYDSSNYHDFLE